MITEPPKDPSLMDIAAVSPCLEIFRTNRHRCRVLLRCQGRDRKVYELFISVGIMQALLSGRDYFMCCANYV